MGIESMNAYDRRAWEQSLQTLHAKPRQPETLAKVRSVARRATSAATGKLKDIPGTELVGEVAAKVMDGTLTLTFQPAMRSARNQSTIDFYARANPEIKTMADVRSLPLEVRDVGQPNKLLYSATAAAQGGSTALAITGAEVATAVTAGATAGVVIGAIATDSVASLAIMGRTIGQVANRYGFDVRLPDEELFAMGVLSLGMAGSLGAKTQALTALSRLTQQMMRRATWRQLQDHVLVRVIQRVYEELGIKLTQRKLGQAVPIAGIVINAALTAQLTEQTFRRAQAVYRLRALSEHYDIDPESWRTSNADAALNSAGEIVVDVIEIFEDEAHQDGLR